MREYESLAWKGDQATKQEETFRIVVRVKISSNKTGRNFPNCCQEKNIEQQNRKKSSELLSGEKYQAINQEEIFRIVVRRKISSNKPGRNLPNYCQEKNIEQQNRKKSSELLSGEKYQAIKQEEIF